MYRASAAREDLAYNVEGFCIIAHPDAVLEGVILASEEIIEQLPEKANSTAGNRWDPFLPYHPHPRRHGSKAAGSNSGREYRSLHFCS
jgi:hypothetical protein